MSSSPSAASGPRRRSRSRRWSCSRNASSSMDARIGDWRRRYAVRPFWPGVGRGAAVAALLLFGVFGVLFGVVPRALHSQIPDAAPARRVLVLYSDERLLQDK